MRILIDAYTFTAASKQITFTGYTTLVKENILMVINVTTNSIVYNPTASATGGTVSGNVLTFTASNAGMADSDALQIFYEDTGVLTTGVSADFWPGYGPQDEGGGPINVDPGGAVITRGPVMTDEGGYRCNFANSSLAVSIGSCVFTNGSDIVTGTGFKSVDVHTNDYVKLDADTEASLMGILSVDSDTQITLKGAYTGTGGTGASSRQILLSKTGAGGTITVGTGACAIAAGTTATSVFEVEREADYLPLIKQTGVTISQRIANQNIKVGLYDDAHASPYYYAWFNFSGTTNTTVVCETARNPSAVPTGNEIESTTITLPNGGTSATLRRLRVELLFDRVNFIVDGVTMATHFKSIPAPHDVMTSTVRVENGTTPATSTTVTLDYDTCKNFNSLDIGSQSDAGGMMSLAPNMYGPFVATAAANNTDFFVLDCSQFRAISIQITSVGGGGTITFQTSNDGATWLSTQGYPVTGLAVASAPTAAGAWVIPVTARYFRARTTAYTSGTLTMYWAAMQTVPSVAIPTLSVSASNLSCNNAQWGGQTVATGGINGTVSVGGLIAGDSGLTVATHKPVTTGMLAKNSTTIYTVSADADSVFSVGTLDGRQVTIPYAYPELTWQYANPTGTPIVNTTDVVLVAATASQRNYITSVQIVNTHATVDTLVVIKDGATVIWSGFADAHIASTPAVPIVLNFPVPLRGSVNSAINFACITTGANVFVSAQGYKGL